MIRFIIDLFMSLFPSLKLRKTRKAAEREVKDVKDSSGMDGVRNRATDWHNRNRK